MTDALVVGKKLLDFCRRMMILEPF